MKNLYSTVKCKIMKRINYRLTIWLCLLFICPYCLANQQLLAANYSEEKSIQQSQVYSLKSALSELEKKHNIRFNYASELIEGKNIKINPELLNHELETSLSKILSSTGLKHERISEKVFGIYKNNSTLDKTKDVKRKKIQLGTSLNQLEPKDILNSIANVPKYQDMTVTGKVTDSENEPLPGVNVQIQGTTSGTVTDFEGKYSVSIPDGNTTLIFSSIGYTTEEVNVGNRSVINVSMVEDVQALSEVVVVGYGTQKKSDLTGSISSVESKDITRLSERRLENALQGRAAGVQVTRVEGNPGGSAQINIRGAGSIGNTEPLWIIDGVPMDPGNFFNLNDIESIEILKDASASAIYGARAAHGVILVTTKRGSEGKVKVDFNAQVGQRNPRPLPDMADTFQFSELVSEARINAGQTPDGAWSNPETLPNTNWVDEIFSGSGIEQMYNLSISGGNENAQFFVSGAYDREEGIMVNNWFERYAVRANSDYKLGKRIRIGQSLLVSRTRENPTANNGGDLQTIFRAIPIMPVRDPDNPFGGWGTGPTYFQGPNPLAVQMQNHLRNNVTRINGNAYAEVDIISGLKVRGSIGINMASVHDEEFAEGFNYGALANPISSLSHRSRDLEQINTNLVATYNKVLGKHDFTVMGGYEFFRSDGIDFTATAQEFPINNTRSFALATGAVDISSRNTIDDQYRLLSFFGRINYSFDNKYLLSANIRRDGSSRFGAANQFGIFPSFSAGWRIIEEGFMQNVGFLSDLKLRASYGILGSDRIGNYIFSPTYRNQASTYAFDPTGMNGGSKVRGFYLRRFPNQEVKWEQVVQTDIGLDVGLFNGKFNLTADYYIKSTTDMLIGVQLPPSFGVSRHNRNPESTQINIGEVENSGFELALNYRERVGDWNFDITGNAAWNQNEVKLLNADQQIFTGGGGHGWAGNINLTEAGQPMGTFFGWISDGIFQTQEEIDALNAASPSGIYQNNLTGPGDLIFRDIDGNGLINADDRTYIGNPWPKMIYGLNANINWKNIDFTVFFQGVAGVDIFNANTQYTRNLFTDYNTSVLAYERWTPENPTNHPRLIAGDPNGNYRRPSSHHVEDGSFLRLRNIQLGYSLPSSLLDRLGMRNARVFVNAQNIMTITGYSGVDPEIGRGNNTSRGIDRYDLYPQTTLVSTGIQVGF